MDQLQREMGELLAASATPEAQHAFCRKHGFESWASAQAYVEGVTVERLVEAVRADDLAHAQAILDRRPELANLTLSYGDERRPIHFAVFRRSAQMAALLMRYGADPHAGIHPHRDATAALTLARERGYTEVAAAIEAHQQKPGPAAMEPDSPSGDKAERDAVATGNIEWLRGQHAAGKLPNTIRWDGGGLLTVAVRHGRPDVLRFLLDLGFDPDERVSAGDGDRVSWSQGFPLWQAAALGHREMAELLLRRGADPNVHVDSSGSAVYSAFSHKQWAMAELLREHGGIVTGDIAALYRRTDLARHILAEAPDQTRDLLHYGACGGAVEIVRLALEQIDWPPADLRWFGPLTEPLSFWHHIPWLYAGNREFDRESYLTCFRLILERCSPNLVASFGRTALHEVATMGDHVTEKEAAGFAQALLSAGARTDRRDDLLESTPLGWACRWGRAAVAEAILAAGADPVESDAPPWAQPRAWAEKMEHPHVLEILHRYGR